MLKSLYPHVDWDRVRAVGLDMDGTLYDEAEFIAQVYRTIAPIIARCAACAPEPVYSFMLCRWLEKGSSYNRIFDEALAARGVSAPVAERAIQECLAAFRSFSPTLTLPVRVQTILDVMSGRYPMFLISDGSAGLQHRKFAALGLGRWFAPDNVGLSAVCGTGFDKPHTRILDRVQVVQDLADRSEVVFFGDRGVDARFATNAGFRFVAVKCMDPCTSAEGAAT